MNEAKREPMNNTETTAANPNTVEQLVRELVFVLDAYEGKIPLISNQGQALDGYSALANFVDIAKRARAHIANQKTETRPSEVRSDDLLERLSAIGFIL